MAEHYDAHVLARTAELYARVVEWARERDDVTIIGGWAVYELVVRGKAMQSRDVDLVLHTEDALKAFLGRLRAWQLVLRSKGRKTFPDAHFSDEGPLEFRLDLFTTAVNDTWRQRFGTQGMQNVKQSPRTLYPSLEWTVADKLSTLHLRSGPDREDKRAKDCIDVYHLVFHNADGVGARQLANAIDERLRSKAVPFLDEACKIRPGYGAELEHLRDWLNVRAPVG